MLALFRRDGKIYCAVITVDEKDMIAHGARWLLVEGTMQTICYAVSSLSEVACPYSESSTFELPFGTAIYPIPTGTVLPWEK